jgi:hypothetical protein
MPAPTAGGSDAPPVQGRRDAFQPSGAAGPDLGQDRQDVRRKTLRLARLRPAPEREFAAYPLWTFTQPKL